MGRARLTIKDSQLIASWIPKMNLCDGSTTMEKRPDEPDFPIMKMRRIANQKVIDSEIALKIAQMIVIEDCGEAALSAQKPIIVSSDGDFWYVTGTSSEALKALARGNPDSVGVLNMRISQFDGQITDLKYESLDTL